MEPAENIVRQTGKSECFSGGKITGDSKSGYAAIADWGLSFLPSVTPALAADLGGNAGKNAGKLLKRYPNSRIIAVKQFEHDEIKAKEYKQKKNAAGRNALQKRDVTGMKIRTGSIDLVTAFETGSFWPGPEKRFAWVHRFLKPGGYFLICGETDRFHIPGTATDNTDGMRRHTAEEIIKALHAAGFLIVQCYHHIKKPWLAVIARQ